MKTRTIRYGTEYMTLHSDGCIERRTFGPSSQWRLVGAVERNNFGHVVRSWSLQQIMDDPAAIPWQFKNGAQRVFVRDLDHGTLREWSSPKHSIF